MSLLNRRCEEVERVAAMLERAAGRLRDKRMASREELDRALCDSVDDAMHAADSMFYLRTGEFLEWMSKGRDAAVRSLWLARDTVSNAKSLSAAFTAVDAMYAEAMRLQKLEEP